MAFLGVEFNENDGGGIALVSKLWLTPRKSEVFWPPYKKQENYYKSLKLSEIPDEKNWKLFQISRKLFEVDDYNKAISKLKQAEITSDLQSDIEEFDKRPKRKRISRRISSDESSEGNENMLCRPPAIKSVNSSKKIAVTSNALCEEASTSNNVLHNFSSTENQNNFLHHSYSSIFNESQASNQNNNFLRNSLFDAGDQTLNQLFERDSALKTILSYLIQIKEQNKIIVNFIKSQEINVSSVTLPSSITASFPARNENDLQIIESYISNQENAVALTSYFKTIGGKDATSLTNNILKRCLTNKLASLFSFRGKAGKRPFSELLLTNVIISAVKETKKGVTEREIEDYIKIWLKHSPQRYKIEKKKNDENKT